MPTLQPCLLRWRADPLPAADAGGGAAGAPRPIRVLLVDDHEDTNRMLMLLLGKRGFQVKTAGSLHEATELAGQNPFDVLVSDMNLPDGNGIELLGMLGDRRPACGAVVVSGFNDDDDVERSRAAGFKAHLSKPVEVGQLETVLRRLVSESEAAA